jgi:hypothetical protein
MNAVGTYKELYRTKFKDYLHFLSEKAKRRLIFSTLGSYPDCLVESYIVESRN